MSKQVRVIDKGWNKIKAELGKLCKQRVKVGVQTGDKEKDGTLLADVAFWNEFGTEKIPARPFMRTAFDNNKSQLQSAMKTQACKILTGDTASRVLERVGNYYEGITKRTITATKWTPNAHVTIYGGVIRTKSGKFIRIRGKKSSQPLIDTGKLRQSIRYVVVPK